jgi:E3 ubiquitin-protein ligase HECTD1
MVPTYVSSLLPIFCVCYQSTMIPSVKRSSLGLIKKLIHYVDADMLAEVTKENKLLVSNLSLTCMALLA